MPVEVVTATADTVVDAILATGQIEAIHSVELRPEIEGRIAAILVREGSLVSKGQALFQVDDAELKAEVARAEAERDLARQSLARTRELLAQKASSQSELERAEATARSTEAQYQLLKVRLDRTTVRAPFSGVAGRRLVSLGDYVTTDTGLLTVQTVTPQRAVFQVPERYADQLKLGQEVTFRVAALPGREFTGRVDFVDPVVQLPGRTITVKAQVPNPRRELQAGMFIEARLATAVRPSAVVIAEDAVLPIQGTNYVWVTADGKATRRQVELGVRTPGFVEARSGVEAGEQVVVGGQERLAEGAPVAATLVDRTPTGGRESVGGTTPGADTAGGASKLPVDTAGPRTDTAVADGGEAGASQRR
jgi:membrane fusion protein (multidrug efflux system)